MKKLTIKLENCYGIAKLEKEFDFSDRNTKVIYAPNGCMKTSLAKTFQAVSRKRKPQDELFPDRISKSSIQYDGADIQPEQILVVDSYSDSYSSKEKMATLLVNPELKSQYQEILENIENKKNEVFKDIKRISGSSNAEKEISLIFEGKNIFEKLSSISPQINETEYNELSYKYGDVINDKVYDFLKSNSGLIEEYLDKYTELIDSSTFFKKGVFGTDNAIGVNKSLADNRFFEANHKVVLEDETIIADKDGLNELVKREKDRILSDEDLAKKFDKIDNAITKNVQLKTLKGVLESEPELISELSDLDGFKKKLWINYFGGIKESFNTLIALYAESQDTIRSIVDQANAEKTEWEKVVDLYNNRFNVPFKLEVLNQDDVILKDKVSPNIGFSYSDGRGERSIDETDVKKSLSTGEKRALYLLNVIFEIEARKKDENDCILILDDIADSFDYKNKYAIIEYLKDISEDSKFKVLLLTHNFDFYRTVASRLPSINYADCFMTIRSDAEVKLVKGQYLRNVFESWVKEIEKKERIFLASIPFARNIIEYIKGNQDSHYLKLTNLLHVKSDTKALQVSDIIETYKTIWADKEYHIPEKPVYDMILDETSRILAETSERVQLETKVILSMAIRLKAEEFMIEKIDSKEEVSLISNYQTTELMRLYKDKFSEETENIKLMEQVNLMTAENIHINAFMYEPILDLSDHYLKDLFRKVSSLN
ncbi:hypothetical protein BY457_12719 [Marinilabilia salmonicolor]|jgi:hypothetical protein|uniref:hypothetical protein n=1 Tax=Marinilabilia salmonicolor TaxID=989 RepID=UPI000D07CDE0|nr:hypothetical protein [Marinilabilia salmonicolor]PRY90336.1 hypothetical protein BY457_12719 [Marinilabilia salmonicolor]